MSAPFAAILLQSHGVCAAFPACLFAFHYCSFTIFIPEIFSKSRMLVVATVAQMRA
jgi:hypothetical protein